MSGTWIRTASGKKFDYHLGADNEIDLFDIAEHLSKIPRFAGACRPNLSVAQHSIHVSALMERDGGGPVAGMYGLFHDAHEAYFGDMPTPFTNYVFEITGHDIKEKITAEIDEAVFKKLGLDWPVPSDIAKRLKFCDAAAFAVEGKKLVKGFTLPDDHPYADLTINPVGQEMAYRMFIERMNKLKIAIQRRPR